MDVKEEELIRSLLDTDPELRRHYEETRSTQTAPSRTQSKTLPD